MKFISRWRRADHQVTREEIRFALHALNPTPLWAQQVLAVLASADEEE